MKKNIAFEQWVADQLTNGMIVMEPYGYREEEPGKYLHVFKVSLYFDDAPGPLEGVAYIPIPFSNQDKTISEIFYETE